MSDGFVAVAAALSLAMVLLWRGNNATPSPERRAYVTLLAATIMVALFGVIFAGGSANDLLDTLLRALPVPFLLRPCTTTNELSSSISLPSGACSH